MAKMRSNSARVGSQPVGVLSSRPAVRPSRWGTGLARRAVERAVGVTRLWCLVDNVHARGFYEHLGWRPTGREGAAEWPPYPVELEYRLPESGHER